MKVEVPSESRSGGHLVAERTLAVSEEDQEVAAAAESARQLLEELSMAYRLSTVLQTARVMAATVEVHSGRRAARW